MYPIQASYHYHKTEIIISRGILNFWHENFRGIIISSCRAKSVKNYRINFQLLW